MIPTFLIDEPILISIGILGALSSPPGWRGSLLKTRAFAVSTALALGFTALAAYGYWVAPDWMWMYLLPAKAVPAWVTAYAFILYYVLYLGGFFLGRELRQWHPSLAWIALLLGLAASVLVILPWLHEYQTIASYEDFHRGFGVPLKDSAIAKHTLIPTILLAGGGLLGLIWAKRQK